MSIKAGQWWDLLKTSVEKTETELGLGQKTQIGLLHLDDSYQWFSLVYDKNKKQTSPFLAQAWITLVKILKNELFIEDWDTLTIKGRNTSFSIFSLEYNVYLVLEHETTVDPLEIIKTMLRYVFELGYQDQYSTVGLVASEGYPVWVISSGEQKKDDFLFAISITSLLSLVERLDMEVSAGGITSCTLTGESNILLSVAFNPSQDLVLATTQSPDQTDHKGLPPELYSLLELIKDPSLYPVHVPEIVDEERERMLSELKEEFEGEITEEEIQTLTGFEEKTLQKLEEEIKSVSRKYRADEISIGYLRKRMQLPPEVLSMSLEYLISNGQIQGRIGRSRTSGQEILVLDGMVEREDEELNRSIEVQNQIQDLFLPLEPFLTQLPVIQKKEVKAEFKEALSEYQIMVSLADSDPLFLLTDNLRGTNNQLENSVKGLILLRNQLVEAKHDEILTQELEKRIKSLSDRIYNFQLDIFAKSRKFYDDLLNYYRLLLRLLPSPKEIVKDQELYTIKFQCQAHNCDQRVVIVDNHLPWLKISLFTMFLNVRDDFPEFYGDSSVQEVKDRLQNLYSRLETMADEEEIEYKLEYYPFVNSLDELIITNTIRENMISNLQQKSVHEAEKDINFFNYFTQCETCKRWYCNKHIKNNKCIYC
ncbi:MAG: hypothetical protein ACTSR2_03550 [Candidatus Hodarchaeales archaeon]